MLSNRKSQHPKSSQNGPSVKWMETDQHFPQQVGSYDERKYKRQESAKQNQQNKESEEEEDDFSIFYQIANSPSRSSSENISPDNLYDSSRPRSKSVMYENTNNLLPPDQLYWRRSPSPSRKSLGTLTSVSPVVKTLLKNEEYSNSSTDCRSASPRRPSLCPMKDSAYAEATNEDPVRLSGQSSNSNCSAELTEGSVCHVRRFRVNEKGRVINEGDSLVKAKPRRTPGLHMLKFQCDKKSVEEEDEDENDDNDKNENDNDHQIEGEDRSSGEGKLPLDNLMGVQDLAGVQQQIQIQILGASGVGKTTLASQFMTSEQICCRMMSVNEETEKLFSVRMDGQEWNVLLHDTTNKASETELRVELLNKMNAYIVLFAIDDLTSFDYSKQVLSDIIKKVGLNTLVFLVGNKADLERSREVKTKIAKNVAKIHRCKFSEISTALNHRVDDLLCSILMEILKSKSAYDASQQFSDEQYNGATSSNSSNMSSNKKYQQRRESQIVLTGRALSRLFRKTFNAKSCEHIS